MEASYASDFALPLVPGTRLPVRLTSTSVRRPSSSTVKLETELSPALVAKRNRLSRLRMTLRAPSKGFGVLSRLMIGL